MLQVIYYLDLLCNLSCTGLEIFLCSGKMGVFILRYVKKLHIPCHVEVLQYAATLKSCRKLMSCNLVDLKSVSILVEPLANASGMNCTS